MIAVVVGDLRHKTLTYKVAEATHSYEHPKNLNAICCDGNVLGVIGVAHPTVAKKIDKKAVVVFAELDVKALTAVEDAGISYREPSKYPSIEVDLSFVTNKFENIGNAIDAQNCPLVQKVSVTDVYEDENGKSITVRIVFSQDDRTLTREEVMIVVDAIIADLKAKGINLKQ